MSECKVRLWADKNGVQILDQKENTLHFVTTKESSFIENIEGVVRNRSVNEMLKLNPSSLNKEQINSALKGYLEKQNIDMLNNYGGIKTKIRIIPRYGVFKDRNGTVGASVLIKRLKSGKGYYPEMTNFNQSTRNEIVDTMLKNVNALRLSDYTGSDSPIKFRVTSVEYNGMTGSTTFSNLKRGSSWSFESLDVSCREKWFNDFAEKRGYKIAKMPTSLIKTERVTLVSPQNNLWNVSWSSFQSGYNCPYDDYNKSYGERMVSAVLSSNHIEFTEQKPFINSDGIRQYIDFYTEYQNKSYCIEYNGIQHYENVDYFKTDLKYNQKQDKLKRKYCEENNITYIEIPYTCDTPEKVTLLLSEFFRLEYHTSNIGVASECNRERVDSTTLIDYYKKNSYRDTVKHFKISKRELDNACKAHGFKKGEWLKNG